MPNFKGHLFGGLLFYGIVVFLFSLGKIAWSTQTYWLAATLAGALFPDIDIRSKGQHLYFKILVLLLVLCLFLQAYIPVVMILFFSLLPLIIPHRGLFHDLGFIAILCIFTDLVLIYLMPHKVHTIATTTVFFVVGVLSHLLLDKGFKKTFKKGS